MGPFDLVQTAVASGNGYTVPGAGTLTSWSNNSAFSINQTMTLAVFRKVADPDIYLQVGHDGPRPLQSGIVNTFSTSLPVQSGDLLGMNPQSPSTVACTFPGTAGDSVFNRGPALNDGQQGQFFPFGSPVRLNLTAVFAPSNTVTLGKTALNKKKGTATLNLTLPNPGDLSASGKGVKASSAGAVSSKAVPAGAAKLTIKAKGAQKQTLDQTGKVTLKVAINYTPTGGDPGTQSVKVKLKKNG